MKIILVTALSLLVEGILASHTICMAEYWKNPWATVIGVEINTSNDGYFSHYDTYSVAKPSYPMVKDGWAIRVYKENGSMDITKDGVFWGNYKPQTIDTIDENGPRDYGYGCFQSSNGWCSERSSLYHQSCRVFVRDVMG